MTAVDRTIYLRLMDYSQIVKCMNFAAVKHSNQRRKDCLQTPYINHPVGKTYLRQFRS